MGSKTKGPSPEDSVAQTKLEKALALYEKLKVALIARDERIDELETQLQNSAGNAAKVELETELHEVSPPSDSLNSEISQHKETIERLRSQLNDAVQEKEMLADLASRRSKSNRSLKDASAEIQNRVPKLETEIKNLKKTVADREASISRLLSELQEANDVKDAQQKEIVRFIEEIKGHGEELAEQQTELKNLRASIQRKNGELQEITAEVSKLNDSVAKLQATVGERDQSLLEQRNQNDKSQVELTQATELRKQAVAETRRAAEQRAKKLIGELDAMRETSEAGRAEIKQLRAGLDQSESWALKMKQSLSEREAELATLRFEMSGLAETRNGLELQLRDAGRVRTTAEQAATAQAQQVADAKVRFDELERRCREQAAALSKMQADLSERASVVTDLREQLNELTTRAEGKRQELTRVIAEREVLAQKLFDLESAFGAEESTSSADESTSSADESTSSADESTSSADESTSGADENGSGEEENAADAGESTSGVEESSTGAEEKTPSAEDTRSAEERAEAVAPESPKTDLEEALDPGAEQSSQAFTEENPGAGEDAGGQMDPEEVRATFRAAKFGMRRLPL